MALLLWMRRYWKAYLLLEESRLDWCWLGEQAFADAVVCSPAARMRRVRQLVSWSAHALSQRRAALRNLRAALSAWTEPLCCAVCAVLHPLRCWTPPG